MKLMEKILLTGLIIPVILTISGCGKSIDSHWVPDTILIDGNDQEWRNSQIVPKDEKFAFGFLNDADKIYLSFRTAEQSAILRILRLGITIWIDPNGGQRQIFGIKYPGGHDLPGAGPMEPGRRFTHDDLEDQIMFFLNTRTMVDLVGRNSVLQERFSGDNGAGLVLQSRYMKGQLILEIQVPLALLPDWNPSDQKNSDTRIGVGLVGGAIDRPELKNKMGGRMGSMPTGGGMDSRRGMQGNRGMRPGGNMGRMMDPTNVWLKINLAESK